MSQIWKTIPLFISSTFRDMHAERDHLVRFVFPKLRQELLQRRIHLVDVDLRWGVTSEQDALSVCREVVDECRPRFLCMLGGRYGWVPPGKTRSITADEVHYGVLDRNLTSCGFAYFYFRDPSASAAMVEVTPGEFREPVGSCGADALTKLKTAIVEAGLQPFIYRAHWDDQSRRLIGLKEFGDRVYADLKRSIDQEFGPPTREKPDEFTEENAAMEAFIEERVQRFVLGSRQPVWNELRQHAESTGGNGYLCLTGVAGSGKSALLGKFCQEYREAHPQDLVIPHFVGASPGSTDMRLTFRRLCHELVTGAGLTTEIPEDPETLRVAFAEILQQAAAQKRVVILLDAINQFDPTTQLSGWSWLPEELPAAAHIILSTLNGPALDSLQKRRQPPQLVELQPLDAQDRKAIINEFLRRYRKSMTDDQREALLAKADAGTPLYLLVALEELRTLGTYEEITDRIAQLPPDTRALFIWILKRLEDDDGFRDASGQKIGRELVSRFVSLLGASRHGLSQRELVELLSPGDPQGNVAALAQLLRSYLMQRGELLDFYHGQFREAAVTSYLPSETQRLAAHDQLATYFCSKADSEENQTWKDNNPRPFLEVVFHLIGAHRTDECCQTLCDLRFVEARCRVGQVFELIADYRLAQENLPEAQADLREERARQERVRRWEAEIIEYACQWSNRRDRLAQGESVMEREPQLPEPVPTCEMWSEEKIQAECDRIVQRPTRRDQLEAFAGFVESQCYPLLEFGKCSGFVSQHAANYAPSGPVHESGMLCLPAPPMTPVIHNWPVDTIPNSKSARLRELEGHTASVNGVSVTPDGRMAISSGSYDKTLRVWDLESGVCLHVLEGHSNAITSVSLTPDGRRAVSGSADGTLRVWDLEYGVCLHVLEPYNSWITSVSMTPDGRRVVSGSYQTLRIWELESGACLRVIEVPSADVISLSMTPDGRRVISGSKDDLHGKDYAVRLWDLEQGVCLHIMGGHSSDVTSLSITPDGRRAVSSSKDKTLRVWDLESGACIRTLVLHSSSVWSVSVTPDGRRAVSGSLDETLRVWDLESGQCMLILASEVLCVSVTADGLRAVSGSAGHTLRLWDLERAVDYRTKTRHSSYITALSVTPDGRRAVSIAGFGDITPHIWDLETRMCLCNLKGHSSPLTSIEFTPDGRHAVSGSQDETLRFWDLENGACLRTLEINIGCVVKVEKVIVAPNGSYTVLVTAFNKLQLLDLRSGACLRAFVGHKDVVWGVRVTPDGRRAMSASGDNTLRVWDLESGQCLRILEGHTDGVSCVALTPDGRFAVSSSWDKTLRVWDLESGKCLRILKGHRDGVGGVIVTLDAKYAISGSQDRTLRVWDLRSGACLRVLEGHSDGIKSIGITYDNRHVFSTAGDFSGKEKAVRIWGLESGQGTGALRTDAPVSATVMSGANLIVGLFTGELVFTKVHNIPTGAAIVTAANPRQVSCTICGHEFLPPSTVLDAIQNRSASANPQLAIPSLCPRCKHPLRFNPFFAAADDYTEVLHRGLKYSRREKGETHEETLAHLAALAVHLESIGKSAESAEFQREHEVLAQSAAARKKT